MNDIVFAVYTPGRKENTGGHIVLHKLIKILDDLGYEVWCTQTPMFSCNAKLIKKISVEREEYSMTFSKGKNLIAIYPEQIKGNPFQAKYVARWILYHVRPDVEETWKNTDEYFYYTRGFHTQRNDQKIKDLTIIDGKLDVFRNVGLGKNRNGYCHINKKKYPKDEVLLNSLCSTNIGDFMEKGGFSYLAEQLNNYEFFITYDDATYYSIAAALCGCRSIIINPDVKMDPDEFRKQYPISKYGVAYGFNDIKHADMTRDMVKDHIKSLEKNSIKSVESFIKFWSQK